MTLALSVQRYDVVDSTNERALESIARGSAHHGDVHVASHQTHGRGRRGAEWHSPAYEGLYLSIVLLPLRPLNPVALTMAAGLAAREAVLAFGVASVELKWPNDLTVAGAKLCGILVETRGLDPERPHYVVGLGLNVKQREFPGELAGQRPVTSLALLGVELGLAAALEGVLGALSSRLEQAEVEPALIARDYAKALGLTSRAVTVEGANGRFHGRLTGLELATGLALALDDGRELRLALEHVRGLALRTS